MKAVITVKGADKKGIIARVSGLMAEFNVNIVDISQTTFDNQFFMIMFVDTENANKDFFDISSELKKLSETIHQEINMRHETVFNSMHRI